MKNIIKIVAIVLLVQLFNLNAADNHKYLSESSEFNELPEEIVQKILSFVTDPNASLEAEILKEIRKLKILAQVDISLKESVQDSLDKKISEYLDNLAKASSPLKAAFKLKNIFAAKWLKNKVSKNPEFKEEINKALIDSAEHGNQDNVRFLIDAGANINTQDQNGYTALMLAAYYGYTDIAEMLIKVNTRVNKRLRNAALPIAAEKGHTDIVELLITVICNLNVQDKYGYTALINASQKGYKDIAVMLITAGADVNIKNNYRSTALIEAAYRNYIDIVKVLINANADVDAQDWTKCTALIRTADHEHTDIVKMLINANTDVNIQDEYGYTALMYAVFHGYKDIVEMLINAGADINIKNKNGETALNIARNKNKTDIVKLLEQAKSK